MINNYTNPVPVSMDEFQAKSRQRNQNELDKLCNIICLCVGWLLVLILFIYMISVIIMHQTVGNCYGDNCQEIIIIEEYYTGSGNT